MSERDETQKTVFHPYTAATVRQTETWLTRMSEEGYQLIAVRRWTFTFKAAPPKERLYCLHFEFGKRGFGFLPDFYRAKRVFGQKPLTVVGGNVFEVDVRKATMDFEQFLKMRERVYFRYYTQLLLFSSVLLLFAAVFTRLFWFGILVPIWIYALTSMHKIKKGNESPCKEEKGVTENRRGR